eukprot:2959554-Pleurochrysis_carterae.AAC.2
MPCKEIPHSQRSAEVTVTACDVGQAILNCLESVPAVQHELPQPVNCLYPRFSFSASVIQTAPAVSFNCTAFTLQLELYDCNLHLQHVRIRWLSATGYSHLSI